MTLITLIIISEPEFNYVIYESWRKSSLTRKKKIEIKGKCYLLSIKAQKIENSAYFLSICWSLEPRGHRGATEC